MEINQSLNIETDESRWKDLYYVGGICGILVSVFTVLAIVIYFIWPYQPGLTSVSEIFATIQSDPFNGLMSLDFSMVFLTVLTIPFFVAIYFSTRKANESYALLALVFGLISCILAFFMRPIAEMFYLSGQYAAATTDVARNQYLAAGEALSALFTGTTWILYYIAFFIELLISSLLMLKIKAFSKFTAFLGIGVSIGVVQVLAVIIPDLAQITTIINLLCTFIWTIWNVLVAVTLFRLARRPAVKS